MATLSLVSSSVLLPLLLLVVAPTSSTNAQVPAASTFKYVNEGDFGDFVTEYDATYRATPLFGAPFHLMWYNTTTVLYYLILRMGLRRSESLFRWVWDGNLVLAKADGTVISSTNTTNKGVVGIKILPVGNIVMYNKKGKFMWQSFDHLTDTLFVSQSLKVQGGGPNKC